MSNVECNKKYDALSFHTAPIVDMGFWTGMQRDEILSLTWDKVDLKNRMIRLEPTDTKEGLSIKYRYQKPLKIF